MGSVRGFDDPVIIVKSAVFEPFDDEITPKSMKVNGNLVTKPNSSSAYHSLSDDSSSSGNESFSEAAPTSNLNSHNVNKDAKVDVPNNSTAIAPSNSASFIKKRKDRERKLDVTETIQKYFLTPHELCIRANNVERIIIPRVTRKLTASRNFKSNFQLKLRIQFGGELTIQMLLCSSFVE